MAKYAIGYVLALLMVVMIGLVAWEGSLGVRLPWMRFGGGVAIGRAVPVVPPDQFPAPEPEAFPGGEAGVFPLAPLDLIVTDGNGSTSLSPTSYCWSEKGSNVCSESDGPYIASPAFLSTAEHPVTLDLQMVWDVTLRIEPEDPTCPAFSVQLPLTVDLELDMLGPPGDYLVSVSTTTDQGEGSWVIRVSNQADLRRGDGLDC